MIFYNELPLYFPQQTFNHGFIRWGFDLEPIELHGLLEILPGFDVLDLCNDILNSKQLFCQRVQANA